MLALIFLVLSFFLGTSILRKTSLKLNLLEIVPAGFFLGTILNTWITFLLSLILNIPIALALTLIISTLTTIALVFSKLEKIIKPKFSRIQTVSYVLFSLSFLALFTPLFFTRMMQIKSDGLYSGASSWGDIALHTTFIERFSQQIKLDLTSPIYASEKTTYPILIDFYASILLRCGFNLQLSLIISGLLYAMCFIQLMYLIIVRITKSHKVALLAPIIFLFNGGFGFWYAYRDYLNSHSGILTFLLNLKVAYTNLFPQGITWTNILADFILPQRAILAGMPIFLLVLYCLNSIWKSRSRHQDLQYLLAFFIGLLPFYHPHTFIVSIGLWLFFILTEFIVLKRNPATWILPILLTIVMVCPQLWWQFSQTFSNGFIRYQFGWMKGNENIFWFWIKNMGLEFFFTFFGGIYFFFKEPKQSFLKTMFVAMVILFIICNFIIFQPYDYDNTKLMLYTHLCFSIITALLLLKIWKIKFWGKFTTAICFLILTLAGSLAILRESYTSWKIASPPELAMAASIRESTPIDSIFLTADSHNELVSMLAGRSLVMGYRGWLWTHGINYTQTEQDVLNMFAGDDTAPTLLAKHHVSFVFIGPTELTDFNANYNYYQSRYPILLQNETGTLFDLRSHKD